MSALRGIALDDAMSDVRVVLVRDLGRGPECYASLRDSIAQRFVVHEMDLLASSPRDREDVSVSDWVDSLERLLDDIPTVSAICIGDNIGSLVVEHFAATRPDRIEGLVLLNPLHALSASARSEYEDLSRRVTSEGIEVFHQWSAASRPMRPTPVVHTPPDLHAIAAAWRAVATAHTSDLCELHSPSLICFNESSQIHNDAAAVLANEIALSTRVAVGAHVDSSAAILQFLSSTLEEVTP